jgi:hypothetical protein
MMNPDEMDQELRVWMTSDVPPAGNDEFTRKVMSALPAKVEKGSNFFVQRHGLMVAMALAGSALALAFAGWAVEDWLKPLFGPRLLELVSAPRLVMLYVAFWALSHWYSRVPPLIRFRESSVNAESRG